MKKSKCFIEFENLENTMLNKMEITKKEFDRQIKFLNERVEQTKDEDEENKIEKRMYKKEFETYIVNTYFYTNCCCDTILTEYVCKDGYKWNTQKHK